MNFMAASGCITSVITNTSLGVTAARPEPIIYAPSTTSNAEHSFCCCTFRDTDMAHSCSKALFIALALCSVHGLAATIPDVQVSTDTAPASALTATAILAGPTVLGSTGYRKLLQQTADGSNSFSPAEDAMASALQQTITPAVVNTTLIADASALKAMKGGDKAASKRAAIRYYWLIACGDYEGAATGAEAAAQQLAATNEVSQFEDAGVADTRNNLIKVHSELTGQTHSRVTLIGLGADSL